MLSYRIHLSSLRSVYCRIPQTLAVQVLSGPCIGDMRGWPLPLMALVAMVVVVVVVVVVVIVAVVAAVVGIVEIVGFRVSGLGFGEEPER